MFAQAPGIRVADMIHPTLHAGVELGEADFAILPLGVTVCELAGGVNGFARLQQPVRRIDDEAQPGYPRGDGLHLCGTFVNGQTQAL